MIEDQILEKAALIRGQFINHVAFIEKMIEILIGNHFCKNVEKRDELIEMLLGDRFVTFESKKTVFQNIFKKHYPNLYKIHSDRFSELTTIQEQRNRFAHLIVYIGNEAEERYLKDDIIAFVKFGYNNTKPHWYDKAELQRLNTAINNVKKWLPELIHNENL